MRGQVGVGLVWETCSAMAACKYAVTNSSSCGKGAVVGMIAGQRAVGLEKLHAPVSE